MRWLCIILILACVVPCAARRQKSTRGNLKLESPVVKTSAKADTIYSGLDSLLFSGYEKAQNSSSENVFVTNRTRYHIKGINLTIEYINSNGEQLHERTLTIKCDLPPAQTRSLDFRSWDKQHVWYYKNTQARHNEYANEFDIRLGVNFIIR